MKTRLYQLTGTYVWSTAEPLGSTYTQGSYQLATFNEFPFGTTQVSATYQSATYLEQGPVYKGLTHLSGTTYSKAQAYQDPDLVGSYKQLYTIQRVTAEPVVALDPALIRAKARDHGTAKVLAYGAGLKADPELVRSKTIAPMVSVTGSSPKALADPQIVMSLSSQYMTGVTSSSYKEGTDPATIKSGNRQLLSGITTSYDLAEGPRTEDPAEVQSATKQLTVVREVSRPREADTTAVPLVNPTDVRSLSKSLSTVIQTSATVIARDPEQVVATTPNRSMAIQVSKSNDLPSPGTVQSRSKSLSGALTTSEGQALPNPLNVIEKSKHLSLVKVEAQQQPAMKDPSTMVPLLKHSGSARTIAYSKWMPAPDTFGRIVASVSMNYVQT